MSASGPAIREMVYLLRGPGSDQKPSPASPFAQASTTLKLEGPFTPLLHNNLDTFWQFVVQYRINGGKCMVPCVQANRLILSPLWWYAVAAAEGRLSLLVAHGWSKKEVKLNCKCPPSAHSLNHCPRRAGALFEEGQAVRDALPCHVGIHWH
jgi:hypothetical protein